VRGAGLFDRLMMIFDDLWVEEVSLPPNIPEDRLMLLFRELDQSSDKRAQGNKVNQKKALNSAVVVHPAQS
jgi:hypothetical protein